jgi:hypothetical protein
VRLFQNLAVLCQFALIAAALTDENNRQQGYQRSKTQPILTYMQNLSNLLQGALLLHLLL